MGCGNNEPFSHSHLNHFCYICDNVRRPLLECMECRTGIRCDFKLMFNEALEDGC
jgi:hypothetical protein